MCRSFPHRSHCSTILAPFGGARPKVVSAPAETRSSPRNPRRQGNLPLRRNIGTQQNRSPNTATDPCHRSTDRHLSTWRAARHSAAARGSGVRSDPSPSVGSNPAGRDPSLAQHGVRAIEARPAWAPESAPALPIRALRTGGPHPTDAIATPALRSSRRKTRPNSSSHRRSTSFSPGRSTSSSTTVAPGASRSRSIGRAG
jgi:hypothetical protein